MIRLMAFFAIFRELEIFVLSTDLIPEKFLVWAAAGALVEELAEAGEVVGEEAEDEADLRPRQQLNQGVHLHLHLKQDKCVEELALTLDTLPEHLQNLNFCKLKMILQQLLMSVLKWFRLSNGSFST